MRCATICAWTASRNKGRPWHTTKTTLCDCGGVSLYDIEDALFSAAETRDIDDAFRIVQEKTHCANLCGKCRTAILELIAELMYNEI